MIIVDAELIDGIKTNRPLTFPNLAAMKISAHAKAHGEAVTLALTWWQAKDALAQGERVSVSKVFTATPVPSWVTEPHAGLSIGGTGFFFDHAPPLPDEIEHSMPDYSLYDGLRVGPMYTDYSIGFATRGCVRHCEFCVNRHASWSRLWSPVSEFLEPSRKKICLCDDNVFACRGWEKIFDTLDATGKRFRFHQGMDERLLDERKIRRLWGAKYDGDRTFAFDRWQDRDIITDKMRLIRRCVPDAQARFYVLCGFPERSETDWNIAMERCRIIGEHGFLPYIMRFRGQGDAQAHPMDSAYADLAAWCNQPAFFKRQSFSDFCDLRNGGKNLKPWMAHTRDCLFHR